LKGQRLVGPLDQVVTPAAGAGVGVDGAAFQCRQRELGRYEHRCAHGEYDEGQQRQQCGDDAHRVLVGCSPGRGPGRLEEGSASGSATATFPGTAGADSARKLTASTGACGTSCLSVSEQTKAHARGRAVPPMLAGWAESARLPARGKWMALCEAGRRLH